MKKIPSLTVTADTELMKFLITSLPYKSRNNIKSLLANKQVFVDGTPVKQFNHPLSPGQEVTISGERIAEERNYRSINIVYEDQHLIVVDKHAGILAISPENEQLSSVYKMVKAHVNIVGDHHEIFAVDWIERDASGLMVFAKSEEIQQLLQADWTSKSSKTYLAIIQGKPENGEGSVTSYLYESKAMKVYSSQDPDAGRLTKTRYTVMKTSGPYSLIKLYSDTGMKNQLRVHMKELGHPIIGDKKYGSKINPIGRLGLHAWDLSFKHPVSDKPLKFETPIPRKFTRLF